MRLREFRRRVIESLDRIDATIERNTEAFERTIDALDRIDRRQERRLVAFERRMDDMRDQIRASTEAVLRVLDRLDNGRAGA